jgi:hypothetical protein
MAGQNEFISLFPVREEVEQEQSAQDEEGGEFHSLFEEKIAREEHTESFDITVNEEDGIIRSIDVVCNCGCGKQVRVILDYEIPV